MSAPTSSLAAGALHALAHEVRQPLSTIESIAYYLALVLPHGDEKVHEQLERIQQLVEQASWILMSAQHLADPLAESREPVDVEELMVRAIGTRFPAGDPPLLEMPETLPLIDADPWTAGALIDNLLMLFRTIATKDHPVKLRARAEPCGVAIEMETCASGYRQEGLLCPGAALSLESARRMAEAQGGSIELRVDPVSGIRLRLMLP